MSRFWLPFGEEGSRFGEDKVAHFFVGVTVATLPVQLDLVGIKVAFGSAIVLAFLWEAGGALYSIVSHKPGWRASWRDLLAFWLGALAGGYVIG